MKNKTKWFYWVTCGCFLIVATICIVLNGLYVKQKDKIEELERQVSDMYIIEDSEVFSVDYENKICYVLYGDQMLQLTITDRILYNTDITLHTDIRKGDIAYFISNYDFTEAVLVGIQHCDD